MIGFLRGVLLAKAAPGLLLDVHGVGYEVLAPMTTFYDLPDIGEQVTLYTHLIVREDAHTLFGFAVEPERELFRSLIKVNGVGAKLALTILSGISVEHFRNCVQNHDAEVLVRLPGIGKKTAERLIIEMQDRLPAGMNIGTEKQDKGLRPQTGVAIPSQEAVSALISLGYKPQDANRMVAQIDVNNMSSEEIIRLALQSSVS